MATIDTYKIDIQTTGIDQVQNATTGILNLSSAIAGIGFTELIKQTVEMASSMQNLGDSFGIATGEVAAFSQAVGESGGHSDRAGQMLAKFYQTLDETANGSAKAEKALYKVGITMNDIRNLSNTDILKKLLDNLAEMEPGAERTAAIIGVLGKSAREIDPTKLNEIIKNKDVSALDDAMNGAADAVRALQEAFQTLELATLQLFQPEIKSVKEFKLDIDDAKKYVNILKDALVVLFTAEFIANLTKAVEGFVLLKNAIIGATTASVALEATNPIGWVALGAAGVALLTDKLWDMAHAQDEVNKKTKESTANTLENSKKAYETYTAAMETIFKARDLELAQPNLSQSQRDQILKNYNQLQQNQFTTMLQHGGMEYLKTLPPQAGTEGTSASEVNAANNLAEIQYIKDKSAAQKEYNTIVLASMSLDKNDGDLLKKNAEAIKKYLDDIAEINKKITIEERSQELTRTSNLNKLNQEKTQKQQDLLNTISSNNAQSKITEQQQLQNQLLKDRIGVQTILQGIEQRKQQEELDYSYTIGEMDQKEYERQTKSLQINQDLINSLSKLNSEQEALGDKATKTDTIRIENAKKLAAANSELAQQDLLYSKFKQDELDKSSDAALRASQEALKDMVTPFKATQELFTTIFNGMNQALINFVNTGKLNFKNLALAIIDDLVMLELRMAEVKLFGFGTAGGGLLGSFFASLFGGAGSSGMGSVAPVPGGGYAAVGGSATPDMPMIVGEQGPELFVPQGAGSIMPNYALSSMMGSQNQSGPISHTVINNNISALDSKSVAQMFVENRKQLLGSVNMAQRELSYGTY